MKIQQVVKASRVRQGDLVADDIGWRAVIKADTDPWDSEYVQLTFSPDLLVIVPANMRVIVVREVS